jgi:hypothetical protein
MEKRRRIEIDITKKSPFNKYKIMLKDDSIVYVNLEKLAEYSDLFATFLEAKDDTVPKVSISPMECKYVSSFVDNDCRQFHGYTANFIDILDYLGFHKEFISYTLISMIDGGLRVKTNNEYYCKHVLEVFKQKINTISISSSVNTRKKLEPYIDFLLSSRVTYNEIMKFICYNLGNVAQWKFPN